MSIEFAALDAEGKTVDTVDPYLSHRKIDDRTYVVTNPYGDYSVVIPDGGKYEVREMETTDA